MTPLEYIKPNLEEWLGSFSFSTDLKVRICETDLFGHVNNTSYSLYYEQGRADYFEHLGFYDQSIMFVVGDTYSKFHLEGYARDALTVRVRTSHFGTKSLKIESAILRKSTGELLSSSWTTIVLVDKETKKTTVIPEFIKQTIQDFEK